MRRSICGTKVAGVIGFAMQPSKPCARMPSRSLADASAVTAIPTTCLSFGSLRIRVKASNALLEQMSQDQEAFAKLTKEKK